MPIGTRRDCSVVVVRSRRSCCSSSSTGGGQPARIDSLGRIDPSERGCRAIRQFGVRSPSAILAAAVLSVSVVNAAGEVVLEPQRVDEAEADHVVQAATIEEPPNWSNGWDRKRPSLAPLPRVRFDTESVENRRFHSIVPFIWVDGGRYATWQ
jgi:hypothetical protein